MRTYLTRGVRKAMVVIMGGTLLAASGCDYLTRMFQTGFDLGTEVRELIETGDVGNFDPNSLSF